MRVRPVKYIIPRKEVLVGKLNLIKIIEDKDKHIEVIISKIKYYITGRKARIEVIYWDHGPKITEKVLDPNTWRIVEFEDLEIPHIKEGVQIIPK
jgi:hypothetical protein